MQVVTHPKARKELHSSAAWYESKELFLGELFLREFERALARIIETPERWPRIHGEHRKHKFDRFPYAIVYRSIDETIHIVAIANLKRRPFYWASRI